MKIISNHITLCIILLSLFGCSQSLIVITNIPSPLVEQLGDTKVLVKYDENIINYQFKSTNIEANESPWVIEFNDSHKKLFDQVLNSFFSELIQIETMDESLDDSEYIKINIKLDKFEFLTPSLASNDNYSVWLKYTIEVKNEKTEYSKKWDITGYGEQGTASLNQNKALINAIDLAIRDTGANLTIKIEKEMDFIIGTIN